MRSDRAHRIGLTLYCLVAIVGSFLLLHLVPWLPERITVESRNWNSLFQGLLALVSVVFGIVFASVVYIVVHFRERSGEDREPRPTRANVRLEIAWVGLPLIAMCVLSFFSYIVLRDQEAPAAPGEPVLHVQVIGEQFAWLFDYPGRGVAGSPTLELPKGELVQFDVTSRDVIHSFWVPEALIKQDAVPGMTTHTQWTPDRTGTWWVVCAQLCGAGHAHMRAPITVVSPAAFTKWIAANQLGKQPPPGVEGANGTPAAVHGAGLASETPPGGVGLKPQGPLR